MGETAEIRRKRLHFRSWHRGTRELDLVLGGFADRHLAGLTPEQLDRYESLIANPDPDIYQWVSGGRAVPAAYDNDVMELIKNFKTKDHKPEITK
ncbi:MAG: succinate dehydrogenase assembly factor 2 [Proteobacteria bacterium]|nr:succinate dehydrogenase assembly factor 2 [Pseudomonadota bacterium]